jgi:hypothetical protein
MQNATQPVQPTQWELKSKPMNKEAEIYKLGSYEALQKLGFTKTAIGLWGAGKGLFSAARTGWGGRGVAGRAGLSGATGSMHGIGNYWQNLAKRSPGTAAAVAAIPTAAAVGTAGYMMGSDSSND